MKNGQTIKCQIESCSHNSPDHYCQLREIRVSPCGNCGCSNVIAQQRVKLGVVPEHIACDYYDWCEGKRQGLVWRGEYMAQYSWSEYTAAVLERMSRD